MYVSLRGQGGGDTEKELLIENWVCSLHMGQTGKFRFLSVRSMVTAARKWSKR